MNLNSVGNFAQKNVNFGSFDYNLSDDYWSMNDIKTNSYKDMPKINYDRQNLSSFYDDVFEHEAQKFAQKQTNSYEPKILGTHADGIDEAYQYCVKHNVSNNTFTTDNAEFSEIDLYC